ncbi:MAG: hypothetical protein SPL02_00640 [Bacilli bacterium]|nr:hypothetical protein [Bacilli bacterium]MDY6430367.1 hypothetical protein [Bacilli bacterium]
MENDVELVNPVENKEIKAPMVTGNTLPLPVARYTGKKPGKASVNRMVLRVITTNQDGSVVTFGLPMSLANDLAKTRTNAAVSSSKILRDIDFKTVIGLVRMGLEGDLFSIDTAEGEHIVVRIEK